MGDYFLVPYAVPRAAGTPSTVPALAQSFPTGLNEIWATTLENNSYSGPSFTAKRADNSASFDIPFVGKHADPSAASHFSGTTAIVTAVYGQINGLTQVAKAGAIVPAFIDADGHWSFGYPSLETSVPSLPSSNNPGFTVADNALLRPSNPHFFCLMNPGYFLPPTGPPFLGQGLLLEYGGTGAFYSVGRYGFGIGIQNGFGFDACQNGSAPGAGFQGTYQSTLGEAHVTGWHVWDFSPSTLECRFDAGYSEINPASASVNITYPSNTQLNIMSDFDGNTPFYGSWRLIGMYGATQSTTQRNAISNFLMSNGTSVTPLPTSYTDSAGFIYAPDYFPSGVAGSADDLFGLAWSDEHGGYADHGIGPSFAKATNLTNSGVANLVRYGLMPYDSDVDITGAQRSERGAYGSTIAKGGTAAIYASFLLENGAPVPTLTGDEWAALFQFHYGAGTGAAVGVATIYSISLSGEKFQVETQRSVAGEPETDPQGSAVPIVRNVWWRMLARVTWSAGGTTDSLQVNLWQDGNSPTEIVNVPSAALFDTFYTTAYPKEGAYTGTAGIVPALGLRIASHQFSTTLSAFDSYLTAPPPLPTH